MSYSKKDEDADQAIVKVDRTAVFQEGTCHIRSSSQTISLTLGYSSPVQLLPYISQKMSSSSHQNCFATIHRGVVPIERSYRSFLRYLEALPEQRSFSPPDDVPHIQRPSKFCVGCNHGDPEYHEGYGREKRCSIQGKRNPGIVQSYRRMRGLRIILNILKLAGNYGTSN